MPSSKNARKNASKTDCDFSDRKDSVKDVSLQESKKTKTKPKKEKAEQKSEQKSEVDLQPVVETTKASAKKTSPKKDAPAQKGKNKEKNAGKTKDTANKTPAVAEAKQSEKKVSKRNKVVFTLDGHSGLNLSVARVKNVIDDNGLNASLTPLFTELRRSDKGWNETVRTTGADGKSNSSTVEHAPRAFSELPKAVSDVLESVRKQYREDGSAMRDYEHSVLKTWTKEKLTKYKEAKANAKEAQGKDFDNNAFNKNYDKNFYAKFTPTWLPEGVDDKGNKWNVFKQHQVLLTKKKVRFSANSKVHATTFVEYLMRQFLYRSIRNCFDVKNKIVKLHHAFDTSHQGDAIMTMMHSLSCQQKWTDLENNEKESEDAPKQTESHNDTNYPFLLYVGKLFRYCKNTMPLTVDEEKDKYHSASLNNNFRRFCSDAIVELLTRLSVMIKEEIETRSVKTVTDETVTKVSAHLCASFGYSFDPVREFLKNTVASYQGFVSQRREQNRKIQSSKESAPTTSNTEDSKKSKKSKKSSENKDENKNDEEIISTKSR
jgi:hypothetical protein